LENDLKAKVRETLATILDPDINKSLEELDSIKNIDIEDNLINIELEIVQPIHLIAEKINQECAERLNQSFPDYESEIKFIERKSNASEREVLKGVKNLIAVSSGKGGVGKSAFTANLAISLSKTGAKVGILDADVYGPSQPTMFGLEGATLPAIEEPDGKVLAYPNEKFGIKVASMGFVMNRDQAAIIRGPMLSQFFTMLFEQIEWGPLDYLLFDLPPGTGDIQLTLTQKIPLTGAIIVTTPQDISIADVRRCIGMFNKVGANIIGIVENMSYFIPPDMPDKKYYIFGKGGGARIAGEKGIALLGEIPLDIEMREYNDNGKPYLLVNEKGEFNKAFSSITINIISRLRKHNFYAGN